MQQRLGVAARLLQTLEHQMTRRLVRRWRLEVTSHQLLQRVAGVLAIDYGGPAFEHFLEVILIQHGYEYCKGTMCRLNVAADQNCRLECLAQC